LPPLVALCRTGRVRDAVLLGLTLGLAGGAGDMYMQGPLLFTLPAAVLLARPDCAWACLLLRRTVLAATIAGLLMAPFVVPFLHFMREFGKGLDIEYKGAQPFAYVPLNLVIGDPAFY